MGHYLEKISYENFTFSTYYTEHPMVCECLSSSPLCIEKSSLKKINNSQVI